jgi:multiple sugar transport system permease protein
MKLAPGPMVMPMAQQIKQPVSAAPRDRSGRSEALLGYLLITPALLLVSAVLIYPTLFNLNIAVREWSWSSPVNAPKPFVGLENFARLWRMDRFWNALRVSLSMVAGGVILQYILGLGLALLLNRAFVGRRVFRAIFLLPMVLAPIVVGIQWRYLLSGNFGVLNYGLERLGLDPPSWLSEPAWGLPILIGVDTWTYLPFAALILLAGLQNVPPDLYEAAGLDGAGPLARFRYITLPFLAPASAIVLLLRGTEIFRAFDVVYVLTGGGPGRSTEVLGMMLYKVAFGEGDLGQAAAMAVIIGAIGMLIGTVLIRAIRTETSLF